MEQINFKLTTELKDKMDSKRDKTGIDQSKYIRRLIERDVKDAK